jgi:hypothetical protein
MTEKGCNKAADHCRPKGNSCFFDIDVLNDMQEEHDAQDREKVE